MTLPHCLRSPLAHRPTRLIFVAQFMHSLSFNPGYMPPAWTKAPSSYSLQATRVDTSTGLVMLARASTNTGLVAQLIAPLSRRTKLKVVAQAMRRKWRQPTIELEHLEDDATTSARVVLPYLFDSAPTIAYVSCRPCARAFAPSYPRLCMYAPRLSRLCMHPISHACACIPSQPQDL